MSDIEAAIIPKSDQVNFDDFSTGPMTFKIVGVKVNPSAEQKVDISLEGTKKFYRPCKSMARVLVAAWGPDSSVYVGRSFTLYGDPSVRWGGMEVGGIRISHMSHIDGQMTWNLTATKGSRKPFTVRPLEPERDWAKELSECKTLDELAKAWKTCPAKSTHLGIKDRTKSALEAANATP